MTSPDGITWTPRASAADNEWSSVTFGNGLFVAVASGGGAGEPGDDLARRDHLDRAATSAADNAWTSVTFGNGLFVAVSSDPRGTDDRVMTSPDGITWTCQDSAAARQRRGRR